MTDHLLTIDSRAYMDEETCLSSLVETAALSALDREQISLNAADLVETLRSETKPSLIETFLAEYGLSTDEGVALMCLAEALLRVPDAETIDALIEDKIAPSDWGKHLGKSASSLVNASTWALMLTGRVLDDTLPGPAGHLHNAIRRLGEPVIRSAVSRSMKEMGRQFVLGETMDAAMSRAAGMEKKGYTYSYDMLGEAALTDADAQRYYASYADAICAISKACQTQDIRKNPGISVKLSALHPRYERAQSAAVMATLLPRIKSLCVQAKAGGMGLNIDAEEADRLTLSLEVIGALMADPDLAGWDGLGVVVQAYGQRASNVIDWLHETARKNDRRLMVRLVKGAYWDTEIKLAQVNGLAGFPVFTRKAATDVSYIACARKLLGYADRIYPQFATHNAHTICAILHMAQGQTFEFQRLHGMGEALHGVVMDKAGARCRIYAPVGAHKDLLAYLVRRLLENGANSSFVNQIVDPDVPAAVVAADPFETLQAKPVRLPDGPALFAPERVNSKGFDLAHLPTLEAIENARAPYRTTHWQARPLTVSPAGGAVHDIVNPACPTDIVGQVETAAPEAAQTVFADARAWTADAKTRGAILQRAADLYEANYGALFSLLAREAGKTLADCVAELREAVDFLRYYAGQAGQGRPLGTVLCISPWNFPLAIFTGQISAALATGNAVIAKPAAQTPLIAFEAVALLHEAGVPAAALQLVPGDGALGGALTQAGPDGVAFTGSTGTALRIRASLAQHAAPGTPLIAETGGLNAMIVDSTALPEQAVRAVIESAFQSAGQRCSALRCLYIQKDVADEFLAMLTGAMDALSCGDPWPLASDVGPVIDADARKRITDHIDRAQADGRILHQGTRPENGCFVPPTLIEVTGIKDLHEEVFGPVLHVARFDIADLTQVIDDINNTGYGLTFGLHTRIDDRVEHISQSVRTGNIYINRNQIGAVVGSQPFGGHGLSGTGPKAGGPSYLLRFLARSQADAAGQGLHPPTPQTLPGPTGESNRLRHVAKEPLLCAGPGPGKTQAQVTAVTALGGKAVVMEEIDLAHLRTVEACGGVIWWGDADTARDIDMALSERSGPIVPLLCATPDCADVWYETHLCIDTTAAGGNADLLGTHG